LLAVIVIKPLSLNRVTFNLSSTIFIGVFDILAGVKKYLTLKTFLYIFTLGPEIYSNISGG
jgi:hypothetical protein